MATDLQIKNLNTKLRQYRHKYLLKDLKNIDESVTRILVNNLLTEVLGYEELVDIKTEYEIKGSYADYIIQLGQKKHFVVEVKQIGVNLNDGHIRQTVGYAANEGIDWAVLTNGRQIELYRIVFGKPINVVKLFSFDLDDVKQIPAAARQLIFLSKHSILKKELETYWKRSTALSPESIARELYSEEVAKLVRKQLRKDTKINFSVEDILLALQLVILEKQDFLLKPKR
ncbi:type I restriction enzyme HsdR N-terminal domain-containing protein [Candidatus Saccharibacteria bacterium]|nr:type I restriction enzyme HsdR N-terminal domain-containing protein [Candidatus Saccharibacteria bacterium]